MDTMQIVNQLDGLHKKYRQAMYLFASPFVLLVIAYIGAPGMGAMAGTVVAVLMFAVPVGTIYASGRMSKINKEYQMMEMLLKNPRCVLSAEQFIEAIWGYESDVENNVVWTYISRLRRILKQLDSHTVIRTAKGIGFALEKDDD